MTSEHSRQDQVFDLFQYQIARLPTLTLVEPFISDAPAGVMDSPLRIVTVQAGEHTLALVTITPVGVGLLTTAIVGYVARRARARKAPYLVFCNQREALLAKTPSRDGEQPEVLHSYAPIYQIMPGTIEQLTPPEQVALANLADAIAVDLDTLHRDGRLDLIIPDADFFVNRLTRAVDVLKPAIKQALQTKLSHDLPFAQELERWAALQGIAADLRSPEFGESIVRQGIYRLLGKIIFYQSLRRAIPSLPEMKLAGVDSGQVQSYLAHCFAEAHKIDYHAVFREDILDRLPFPEAASTELCQLVEDLNTRDFAHLPQDVIGAVFERLIPPEERHALGQYFTTEPLVDLIVTFCVHVASALVLDPTCGTATFLLRTYDRLRTALGVHDHSRLLGQLWGVDLAPFPAELATINLFRQQIGSAGNFPRILNEDFFNVVPGGVYRFPPLKVDGDEQVAVALDGPMEATNQEIPQFDAIVGNFPYISASRIEEREAGYLRKVNRRLAAEWLRSYPAGFTFASKKDQKAFPLALKQNLNIDAFLEEAESVISAFADLYISLFWHATAFLKPGGRMGIVTSNAWLDVGYGHALQRFFLDHFKIVAILESRCEPWFEQAAVNTVVTILERCDSAEARDAHGVAFVKIKRPLTDMIPWDMRLDALRRWQGLDGLVQRIEAAGARQMGSPQDPITVEDADFRIRVVHQGELRKQVEAAGQVIKWGPYLRAPQVYFDLLLQARQRLSLLREVAPPARGSLTGNNEFYHFDDAKIAQWQIEPEFLRPLLKSPGDSNRILVDQDNLRLKVFVCRLDKAELKAQGKLNALRYIEWGEQQVFTSGAQSGQTWPHGAEVRNRKPGWYALPGYRIYPAQLFLASAVADRHIYKFSNKPLIADKRLYFLSPVEGVDHVLVAAILNSSITMLFAELAGRVTLGDGALELTVEDASQSLWLLDIRKITGSEREALMNAFQPLLERPIQSVIDEVNNADRKALDEVVVRLLGLDPKVWLPRIYDALATLVGERMSLAEKRSQSRKARPKKAAQRVGDEVLQDLLPDGPSVFPDSFLSDAAVASGLREITLPSQLLQMKGHFFGREELMTEDGQTLQVSNPLEARYVLYAQANGQTVARIPQRPVEISRAVKDYEQYLRNLREQLQQAYYQRSLDRKAAERFVVDVWRRYQLPELKD
jgi:hypothetical protein